jgi:uncharacterized protein YigE (DUF2233 family)
MRGAVGAALGACLWAGAVGAAECSSVAFRGAEYTVCEVDPARDELRLFLTDETGEPYGSFGAVEDEWGPLSFAMNAGMYHPDRRPVGLYIEDGREVAGIVTREGPGNFGMLPNGVFCVEADRARVIESRAFDAAGQDCLHASQSGPMLVIGGNVHPRFIEGSEYTNIRNGVGTSATGDRVVFAISDEAVNFFDFALLFRDHLGLPDALYFDGTISRLYAPGIGRNDLGRRMGPIVGVLDRGADGG